MVMEFHDRLAVCAHDVTDLSSNASERDGGESMHDAFRLHANVIGTHGLTVRRLRVDSGQ